jgi:hypothetical protein
VTPERLNLNVSPSLITCSITCSAASEIFGRHRWNMITPAKMIGETADWTLFTDPTKRTRGRRHECPRHVSYQYNFKAPCIWRGVLI